MAEFFIDLPDVTMRSSYIREYISSSNTWITHTTSDTKTVTFDASEFFQISDTEVQSVYISGYVSSPTISGGSLRLNPIVSDKTSLTYRRDFSVSYPVESLSDSVSIKFEYTTGTLSTYDSTRHYSSVSISGIRMTINYETTTTACGAPTSVSLDITTAETSASLSWSGATDGTGNVITGYQVQYSDSADGTTWGAWTDLGSSASSPMTVTPNPQRGAYRRFRVCAVGTAGDDYKSSWTECSDHLITNVLPGPPSGLQTASRIVEGDSVTLTWQAGTAGSSAVSGYRVEGQKETGDWTLATESSTVSGLTCSASMLSAARGEQVCFRVCTVDSLGGRSSWIVSQAVMKNRLPGVPSISWPVANSTCLSKHPIFGVSASADQDGQTTTLQFRKGSNGDWVTASGTIPASGCSSMGFRLPAAVGDLSTSWTYIYMRLVDSLGAAGDSVSVYVRRGTLSLREITGQDGDTPGTVISNDNISHQADLATLLSAVNGRLAWFGDGAISYNTEVGLFANWLPQMQQLHGVLRGLYARAGETVQEISQEGNWPTAATFNLVRSLTEGL